VAAGHLQDDVDLLPVVGLAERRGEGLRVVVGEGGVDGGVGAELLSQGPLLRAGGGGDDPAGAPALGQLDG
jgi:hypothetical protein